MCTAISFKQDHHYFGRNLDLDYRYNEAVSITPRNYPFQFRCTDTILSHYAMIGIATVDNGYPLYYDATNEHGLSMAGLNSPGNAVYLQPSDTLINITPFELIPWVLSQCKTTEDAAALLTRTQIVDIPYNAQFGQATLHWLISDSQKSIVLESTNTGLHIHQNPIGVLTNNPPFEFHMQNLRQYLNLTNQESVNRFSSEVPLTSFSRGTGAFGLPGDLSSPSRFIRAAFFKLNAVCEPTENSCVQAFFHLLQSVAHPKGCVQVGDHYEITVYSSCCNTDTGDYYYTTHENSQVSCVKMHSEDLNSTAVISYPLIRTLKIHYQN